MATQLKFAAIMRLCRNRLHLCMYIVKALEVYYPVILLSVIMAPSRVVYATLMPHDTKPGQL